MGLSKKYFLLLVTILVSGLLFTAGIAYAKPGDLIKPPTTTELATRLDALEQRVNILETENASLKADMAKLQTDNSALTTRVVDLETSRTALGDRVTKIETIIQNLNTTGLEERIAKIETYLQNHSVMALEEKVASLEALMQNVSRVSLDGYDTLRFSNMNVQIVNGQNDTETANGLGNLIVGYNEEWYYSNVRTGSHYVIVGKGNSYYKYGGIVAGYHNTASESYSSVTGGRLNTASGTYSSVTGGMTNTASGSDSSVTGGCYNAAGGLVSSVSGGSRHTASGTYSSVTGGEYNTASGGGVFRNRRIWQHSQRYTIFYFGR